MKFFPCLHYPCLTYAISILQFPPTPSMFLCLLMVLTLTNKPRFPICIHFPELREVQSQTDVITPSALPIRRTSILLALSVHWVGGHWRGSHPFLNKPQNRDWLRYGKVTAQIYRLSHQLSMSLVLISGCWPGRRGVRDRWKVWRSILGSVSSHPEAGTVRWWTHSIFLPKYIDLWLKVINHFCLNESWLDIIFSLLTGRELELADIFNRLSSLWTSNGHQQ